MRGSAGGGSLAEQVRPRKAPGVSTESAGSGTHPRRLFRNRPRASRGDRPGGDALPGRLAGRVHRPPPTARAAREGSSRLPWWKRLLIGLSGSTSTLRRHSVGFPQMSRDPDESRSVHLSGGAPGGALPPYDPCPPGRPAGRPARSRRRERRGSHPMHQQPTPPSTAEDQCRPWARRACLPPDSAHVAARQIIAAPPSPEDLGANSAPGHDRPAAPDPGSRQGRPLAPTPIPIPGQVRSSASASAAVPAQVRSPAPTPGRSRRTAVSRPVRTPQGSRPAPELPPTHAALICVALPGLAISDGGQLGGRGLDGFYRAGIRLLSRCQVRVAGREPLAVLARMTAPTAPASWGRCALRRPRVPIRMSWSSGPVVPTVPSGSRSAAQPCDR